MLCQDEQGVLSGSEYFLPTVSDTARELYYYTTFLGHYHCEKGYRIERKTAHSYLLTSIHRGQLVIHSKDTETIAQTGQTALIDCHHPHLYYANGELEFSWVHLSGANSQALCDHLTGGNGHLITTQQYEEVRALLHQLLSRFRNRQNISEARCSRTIYDLLCCLMPDASLPGIEASFDTPAGRASAFIHTHLREPLTLSILAKQAKLSPYHFTRVFKKETGYTPYEYIILCRIDHAKYLLKNSALSIKAIASQVGYHTEISFINAFTQKVGISPGRFRKFPIG